MPVIEALAEDAARWRFCIKYGFPRRAQNDRPGFVWLMYADPATGAPAGNGNTPEECVDNARKKIER
jgi:hypothetical protein